MMMMVMMMMMNDEWWMMMNDGGGGVVGLKEERNCWECIGGDGLEMICVYYACVWESEERVKGNPWPLSQDDDNKKAIFLFVLISSHILFKFLPSLSYISIFYLLLSCLSLNFQKYIHTSMSVQYWVLSTTESSQESFLHLLELSLVLFIIYIINLSFQCNHHHHHHHHHHPFRFCISMALFWKS